MTLTSFSRSLHYKMSLVCNEWGVSNKHFALYLEDYLMENLMEKRCTWDNGSLWLKDRPCKIYVGQWPIFHGPLILPYIIVRLKLFLYIKKWHRPGVFMPLRPLALVSFEISNKWPKWQQVSVYIKTLSPGGCMPPASGLYTGIKSWKKTV